MPPPDRDRPPKPRAGRGRPPAPQGADRNRPPRPAPLRRYGQNHLVDANVLAAIVKQAEVRPDDVVLEVGAADGLLTRPLLERARVVHAFEVDQRFSGRLERLAAGAPGLRLHLGDALKAQLGALDPAPTALVANLAYNIAIPLIMTSIVELPGLRRWAVMVQKELGERLFAAPSTKAYAAVSVLTQLACELEQVRPVARGAFRPRPRVDSSFVTFTRRPAAADGTWRVDGEPLDWAGYQAVGGLVRRAFAQRRKQLGTSLAGAAAGEGGQRGAADGREVQAEAVGRAGEDGAARGTGGGGDRVLARADVARALEAAGAQATARPEELAPAQWLAFARALGRLAPA